MMAARDNNDEANRASGFVKWYRSILEHPLWRDVPTSWFRVAFVIVMRTNWTARKWYDGKREVSIPAGSLVTSSDKLAAEARTSRMQARSALDYLKNTNFVTIKTTNRYTVVSVTNWDVYQNGTRDDNQQNNQPVTSQQPAGNQPITTTKKFKHSSSKKLKQKSGPRTSRKATGVVRPPNATLKSDLKIFLSDDDEAEGKPSTVNGSWDTFRSLLRERHGGFHDIDRTVSVVRTELDRGNVPLADFLILDSKVTKSPDKLTNPAGHYRKLAQELAREARRKAQGLNVYELAIQMEKAEHERCAAKRCPICSDGILASGAYCGCKAGQARQEMAERFKGEAA